MLTRTSQPINIFWGSAPDWPPEGPFTDGMPFIVADAELSLLALKSILLCAPAPNVNWKYPFKSVWITCKALIPHPSATETGSGTGWPLSIRIRPFTKTGVSNCVWPGPVLGCCPGTPGAVPVGAVVDPDDPD